MNRGVTLSASLMLFAVFAVGGVAGDRPQSGALPLGLIEPDLPMGRAATTELVELGRRLFFDPLLSGTGSTSCATCHDPTYAFAESRAVSVSDLGSPQKRNAPSLFNVAYMPLLMWDGRFRTLEQQAIDPFRIDGDMGRDLDGALSYLRSNESYRSAFLAATGGEPTTDGLAAALAAFERTLLSGNSRFDRYVFGGDTLALSALEVAGLAVFSTRAGCINCHDVFHPLFNPLGGGVALFTDFRFHNIGVGFTAEAGVADIGRFYSSKADGDIGAFRTPTLRNVALTAPYMHDGSLSTLHDVVDFYDRGGQPNPHLSVSIAPLHLSASEKQALVAFLWTLTDPAVLAGALGTVTPR